jgi:hypothetical protein
MNSKAPVKLLPVLRRPRREWQIPLYESPAQRQAREEKEARCQARTAGTTPYGREIFRRTSYLAWRLVEAGQGTFEATKQVDEQIRMFPEVHAELVLLLGRTWQENLQDWGLSSTPEDPPVQLEGTSPWGWAMLLVLRARIGQKLNQQLAAQDSTNKESDAVD